jgi:acyl-CoA synthetase (AMP-forming)/AMP-acid ligase II
MTVLGQAADSINWRMNGVTDGYLTCAYQEVPEIVERVEQHFAERGVELKDCIALECLNSVPSALVLLCLLEKGYSFLLLPRTVNISQALGKMASIPRFCRYRITTENFASDGSAVDLKRPEQFLDLVENECWADDNEGLKNPSRKLYLRTSGSTGSPKIAVHLHTKLLENALNCAERLRLTSEDRIAIPVPIFHMYGLGAAFLPGVAVGASIDLQKGANLLRYLQREKEFVPNVTFMTPAFCETLLKARKSPRDYKLTVAAGDRVREDMFTKFESLFGCLVKVYGSTEMGAIAASNPDEPCEVRIQTVGIPMSGVQIRVEKGEVEAGSDIHDVGELWCQHKYGFEGYVDENGKSLEESSADDWFRTKDLGRIWADGHLEVLGRCDHSVNRDGLLVLFSDVERVIESIEGIESVVVVSKGESQRGKGIVAYCVLAQEAGITEADIRSACFEKLPRRAVPDLLWIVKSLPTLPNGKVDRQRLITMDDEVNSSKFIQI